MTEQQRFDQLYQESMENGHLIFAGALLQRAAHQFPNKTALLCNDEKITFADLFQRASYVSYLLHDAGVRPRDRVFILFENSIDFYVAYFGAWQTGAIIAPLNTFLHEKELHHIVNDAKPKALIAHSSLVDLCDGLIALRFTEKDFVAAADVPQERAVFPVSVLESDECAIVLYTSGTTGFPKGVMLSSKNIITNLIQGASRLCVTPDERIFAVLPLFHVFAQNTCVWAPLFAAATVVVVPKITKQEILRGLEQHKPTIFLGVPALYGLLCLMRTAPLDSVRYFLSGGDALTDKIRSAFELIYRRKICNGYGLTESSPVISAVVRDTNVPANCVGKPVLGLEVSIRGDQGAELPIGKVGVLWVKGDNVMLGYLNAPEQTAKVIVDGWLNTGDLAFVDQLGYIFITGREKDLIISKGFNIYPQEIENIIMNHPAVTAVAVLGKHDQQVGEIPVAFVSLRQESPTIEQELRELCAHNIAAYKVPRHFIVLKELPTMATGKVDKKKLKADYLSHN